MAYIIVLFIALFGIFSAVLHISPTSGIIQRMKAGIYNDLFPKNERQILIDNIQSQQSVLDKFFSQDAQKLLDSPSISAGAKQSLKNAVQSFANTNALVDTLIVKENANTTPVQSVVQKILGIDNKTASQSASYDSQNKPVPTYIPPQCRLDCTEN